MENDRLVAWVGSRILPHEGAVRSWLARVLANRSDVDDVIQEAYCRMWSIPAPEQIANPRAYFFQMARNIMVDELRRAKVVKIEAMSEIGDNPFAVDELTPEHIAGARSELKRIQRLIEALPPRSRNIFALRKIEGLSQREIAARLGVTENVVENDLARGLKSILRSIEDEDDPAAPAKRKPKNGRQRGGLD
jgi:RNA polymerase sigma-70 factor (ECF subfamily)